MTFIISFLAILTKIFLIYFSWNWFVVPYFHLSAISFIAAILIEVVIGMITTNYTTYNNFVERSPEEKLNLVSTNLIIMLYNLLILYGVKLFLP